MYNELTKNDIKKMREEIEYRKIVLRKELLEDVKEARAHGDLSENFEYHAAKKEKNKNESRIRYLERMIKTAKIVSDESKEDEVGLNNTVHLYFEEDDEVEVFKLVTTVRGNSLKGLISTESPIGKAILGKKAGDRVFIRVSGDAGYYVVIKEIEIQLMTAVISFAVIKNKTAELELPRMKRVMFNFFLRIFRFLLENNHTLDTFSFYTKSQIVD